MKKYLFFLLLATGAILLILGNGCAKKPTPLPPPPDTGKMLLGTWTYERITDSPGSEETGGPIKIKALGICHFLEDGMLSMEVESWYYRDQSTAEQNLAANPLGYGLSKGEGTYRRDRDREIDADIMWKNTIYRCDTEGKPLSSPLRESEDNEKLHYSIVSITNDQMVIEHKTVEGTTDTIELKRADETK
jgi:hypothetical protein